MNQSTNPTQVDHPFRLADLSYELPEERIAQHPSPQRDGARLLVVNRKMNSLHDETIAALPGLLDPHDLLVLNDTQVLQARLPLRRRTGGRVDGLFLRETSDGEWQVMLEGSRRLKIGETLETNASGYAIELLKYLGTGVWCTRVTCSNPSGNAPGSLSEILNRIGETPLPPYIRRTRSDPSSNAMDRERYQTVYACHPGAVAAPTAGLHLSADLLTKIRARNVGTACVTLHVGAGTFKPISVDDPADHVMHEEWFNLDQQTVHTVEQCRHRGGRVVAVGTTAVRVLETAGARSTEKEMIRPTNGQTNLFIYPPYRFQVVDALLTNFHWPHSTLLALVMAFAGTDLIRRAYQHAISKHYRFFSYGDAMLIL